MSHLSRNPQPLPDGAGLVFRAGHAVISLQEVRPGVFSVLTMQGTERVAEWSCSYADEQTARAEAHRAAVAFRTWGTAEQIAQARERAQDKAEHWRLRRGLFAAGKTEEFDAQADALRPLRGKRADDDLAAAIAATIEAAARVQPLPPSQRSRTWADLRAEFAATHPTLSN